MIEKILSVIQQIFILGPSDFYPFGFTNTVSCEMCQNRLLYFATIQVYFTVIENLENFPHTSSVNSLRWSLGNYIFYYLSFSTAYLQKETEAYSCTYRRCKRKLYYEDQTLQLKVAYNNTNHSATPNILASANV